jgi:hypothetical protein
MDSSESEHEYHEDHTESTRSIPDPLLEKFTPPEALHASDEDALFYGDDYEESYMSEDNDSKAFQYAPFPISTK